MTQDVFGIGFVECDDHRLHRRQGFLAGDIIDDGECFGDIGQTDEPKEFFATIDGSDFAVVGGADGGADVIESEGMGDFNDITLHDAGHIDVTWVSHKGMQHIFAGNDAEELIALDDSEIGLVRGEDIINDAASAICGRQGDGVAVIGIADQASFEHGAGLGFTLFIASTQKNQGCGKWEHDIAIENTDDSNDHRCALPNHGGDGGGLAFARDHRDERPQHASAIEWEGREHVEQHQHYIGDKQR